MPSLVPSCCAFKFHHGKCDGSGSPWRQTPEKRALCPLLHPWLLAETADDVAYVRGVAMVVSQDVERRRIAVHQVVHFVGDLDRDRHGAFDLIGAYRDGDAVWRVL
eukprot:6212965-Pleurochrysis_carterae.AAC.1